jgi:hypothetical protein
MFQKSDNLYVICIIKELYNLALNLKHSVLDEEEFSTGN